MIGFRLKLFRRMRGITQQDLSDRIGISRSAYAAYELNRTEPDIKTIIKLADFYDISVDILLDHNKTNHDPLLNDLIERITIADDETKKMILKLLS